MPECRRPSQPKLFNSHCSATNHPLASQGLYSRHFYSCNTPTIDHKTQPSPTSSLPCLLRRRCPIWHLLPPNHLHLTSHKHPLQLLPRFQLCLVRHGMFQMRRLKRAPLVLELLLQRVLSRRSDEPGERRRRKGACRIIGGLANRGSRGGLGVCECLG